jgi:hypothetical protein
LPVASRFNLRPQIRGASQIALYPGLFINPVEADVTVCDAITCLATTQKHDVSVILSEAKDPRRFFAALRMTAHPDE